MVTKVNGGIKAGTNLAGHLQYLKIVGTAATYLDEVHSYDGNGNLVTYPNSDLEKVVNLIQQKGTTVILSVENDTTIHVAIENAGDGWNADSDATVDSLAYQIKNLTAATACVVTVGAFRVA
jgi:hypothetical protein